MSLKLIFPIQEEKGSLYPKNGRKSVSESPPFLSSQSLASHTWSAVPQVKVRSFTASFLLPKHTEHRVFNPFPPRTDQTSTENKVRESETSSRLCVFLNQSSSETRGTRGLDQSERSCMGDSTHDPLQPACGDRQGPWVPHLAHPPSTPHNGSSVI